MVPVPETNLRQAEAQKAAERAVVAFPLEVPKAKGVQVEELMGGPTVARTADRRQSLPAAGTVWRGV